MSNGTHTLLVSTKAIIRKEYKNNGINNLNLKIMSRLSILKQSLDKKENKFNEMINNHFDSVRSANGQPLNDKRNGYATMRKWDNQNNALINQQKEIEKTKNAIFREEFKQDSIKGAKEQMPMEILELINNGILKQWGKHPNIMFVDGVDKARIIWDNKKKVVMHKYYTSIIDDSQKIKFRELYNKLYKSINSKN